MLYQSRVNLLVTFLNYIIITTVMYAHECQDVAVVNLQGFYLSDKNNFLVRILFRVKLGNLLIIIIIITHWLLFGY